jgi:hypothetical protein
MTCWSALAVVSVFERPGTAEPEARLLGVGERGWPRRRTGRAGWRPTTRTFLGAGIVGPARRAEPAEEHRHESDQEDERGIGQRKKVERSVDFLWHLHKISRELWLRLAWLPSSTRVDE